MAGAEKIDVPRPYYHQFAWAYDLLQADPIAPRVDFIQTVLEQRGITGNSTALDAGCGTGRYASELAKRGFRVCGVDRSPELIAVAQGRDSDRAHRPSWVITDLLEASFPDPFDAVLCRGVLNDFVDDAGRSCIFHRFASWLRLGGILIFDVRDWAKSVTRYTLEPFHRRNIQLPGGTLQFQSETVVQADMRRLLIKERFDVDRNGTQTCVENDFVMRCWSTDEVSTHLSAAGLDVAAVYPSYGEDDHAWTDRIVTVASKVGR
jgi:SAM-dependent methyltransferase